MQNSLRWHPSGDSVPIPSDAQAFSDLNENGILTLVNSMMRSELVPDNADLIGGCGLDSNGILDRCQSNCDATTTAHDGELTYQRSGRAVFCHEQWELPLAAWTH